MSRRWRGCSERYQREASSSTAVKTVGEPDARNPHVRFDERGWETERTTSTAFILDSNRDFLSTLAVISAIIALC